jgi:hypothetical protein
MMMTVLTMTNPAGGGGQRLEDDWMGYLLTNDADCSKH